MLPDLSHVKIVRKIYLTGCSVGDGGQVAGRRALQPLLALFAGNLVPPGAVDPIEGVGFDGADDALDRGPVERNVVRKAAHEAHPAGGGGHHDGVAGELRPLPAAPAAQCSTVLPEKCPPQRTSV